MPDSQALRAARLICAYLAEHRDACDCVDGIARWWLPPGTACSRQVLIDALQTLHARGLVEELPAADGRKRYRRPDSDDLDEAQYRALAEARIGAAVGPGPH